MSKRDITLLLEDMLDAALKIRRYTSNLTFDSFINDEKTIDAVVRNFETSMIIIITQGADYRRVPYDTYKNKQF